MSVWEWWLRYGWPDVLLEGYAVPFTASTAWIVAAALRRWRGGTRLIQTSSIWWTLPVAVWALQALLWALATTQLDLVTGFSRVPFMVMYAGTSFLAGLCVAVINGAGAVIAGARITKLSRPAIALVSLAWVSTAFAWVAVVFREMALERAA